MFRSDQIITSTVLTKDFARISALLRENPQALLLIQKKGAHLVLVNASIFEELLYFKLRTEHPEFHDSHGIEEEFPL